MHDEENAINNTYRWGVPLRVVSLRSSPSLSPPTEVLYSRALPLSTLSLSLAREIIVIAIFSEGAKPLHRVY
jgi:hypothetical protein